MIAWAIYYNSRDWSGKDMFKKNLQSIIWTLWFVFKI